jgi:TetR/AcrR family transcriptional repressor of nem operon
MSSPGSHNLSIALMRTTNTNRNLQTTTKKKDSHDRIVSAAARRIRSVGFDGAGIADIMKSAGLTHGGFYAHFPSREVMLVEALTAACAESASFLASVATSASDDAALERMLDTYLSQEQLTGVECGCPLAALGSESARQSPRIRQAISLHVKKLSELIARNTPHSSGPDVHERSLVTVAAMVGTLILARAVDDPALSSAIRQATLTHFQTR